MENDYYLQFINEECKKDDSGSLSLNDFYNKFKTWFQESYYGTGMKCPSKNEVRTEMINKWGDCPTNKWYGWRLKRVEDEIEEGNAIKINKKELQIQSN